MVLNNHYIDFLVFHSRCCTKLSFDFASVYLYIYFCINDMIKFAMFAFSNICLIAYVLINNSKFILQLNGCGIWYHPLWLIIFCTDYLLLSHLTKLCNVFIKYIQYLQHLIPMLTQETYTYDVAGKSTLSTEWKKNCKNRP